VSVNADSARRLLHGLPVTHFIDDRARIADHLVFVHFTLEKPSEAHVQLLET
jgi:hypothetical protein